MRNITIKDIEALKIGAGILGSGGGGDPALVELMAKCQMEKYGPVNLISVDELKEDDLVVPVGFAGAPAVALEQLDSGDEFIYIFDEIERYLGKRPTVIMPVEIGGSNAFTPFYVAGKMGIPVLDADGMGRAFPELQMVSFSLYDNILPQPAFMADFKGNTAIINAKNNANNGLMIENIGRNITIAMGSNAALVLCLLTCEQALKSVVRGSVSLAISIGESVINARNSGHDPVETLVKNFDGFLIGSGVIEDIDSKIDAGFLRGSVSIVNSANNKKYRVEYQNENLVVYENSFVGKDIGQKNFLENNFVAGKDIVSSENFASKEANKLVVTTPDIIAILDSKSGEPVTTESLRYGLRVSVVALASNEIWKTEKGLQLVGPRYFGYDVDYVDFRDNK